MVVSWWIVAFLASVLQKDIANTGTLTLTVLVTTIDALRHFETG